MASTEEKTAPSARNPLPLREVLDPLKEALGAVHEAQRRSEDLIQRLLDRLELLSQQAPAAVDSEPPPPTPSPETPAVPAMPRPATPEVSGPAKDTVSARAEPSKASPGAAGASEEIPSIDRALRTKLMQLEGTIAELDRIPDAETILKKLFSLARERDLRVMLLHERGRSLYAEAAEGFLNFEGERESRLRKVVVPYDPDGLFAAVASERHLYSGPRPLRGLPVDLVLVMGKRSPAWCLLVPLPYRNRWGRFLYIDAPAERLTEILEVDLVARAAVLQLRAARQQAHRPADKIRSFRLQTLRDRRRRRQRVGQGVPAAPEPVASEESDPDPLSRRKRGVETAPPGSGDLHERPDPARFDADGNLVHPLRGEEILSRIGELPTMPHVAARAISMLGDPESTVAALQEVIGSDQALSVRLLQIANSSLYGTLRDVNTIGEAVMRLGFTAVRSWLLSTVTRAVFGGAGEDVARERLWRQSVICAMAAQQVAERAQNMDPEIAFVGGLLQNIGLLLLARNHPAIFDEIQDRCAGSMTSYYLVERQILGFDHADVGALLLQRWGLGDSLVSAVSSHHRLDSAGSQLSFAAVIALAEELALRIGQGPTEASEEDLSLLPACTTLGLAEADLDEISGNLAQMILDRSLFSA